MATARRATKSTMMATAGWATATTMARSDDDYDDNDDDGSDGATGDEVDMMAMTTTMATHDGR